jgi:hypothetical protein
LLHPGLAPRESVSSTASLIATFAATDQGSTTAPRTITVSNSGAATVHIGSVTPSGANPGDLPLGNGSRAATVLIADDAPQSM